MYGNAFKLRVLLSEQLVLLSLAAKKFIMAHQFKQMYCEEITDIKKQFTLGESTTAIIVELIKRKIDELQRKKEGSISATKTNELFGGTTPMKRKTNLTKTNVETNP